MRLTGKNKRILVILAVLVLVFSVGCGKKKKKVDSVDEPEIASKDYLSGVDEDTLIMNSDGGIIEIACDDYSGESFDYSTLSDDIQKEIDAFNESKGKDKVSLLQYSESAGKVKAAIRYLNIEAYNEFNGTDYKLQMYEPSECNIIVLEEEKKKAESMASSEELAEAGINPDDEDSALSSVRSDAAKAVMKDASGGDAAADEINDSSLMMLVTDMKVVFDAGNGEVRYVNHHASINGRDTATTDGKGQAVIVFTLGLN